MKKTLLILAVVALAIPLLASTSFGAAISGDVTSDTINSDGNPDCEISLSKNVSFGYTPDAATDAQSYAIQSHHTSGDKDYGTSSDTTLLYWNEDDTTDDVGAPSASTSTEFNSWNTL